MKRDSSAPSPYRVRTLDESFFISGLKYNVAMEQNPTAISRSVFLKQTLKGTGVFVGLMILGFLLLAVFDRFSFDTKQGTLGVREPAFRQLASYYNPLWGLLACLEYFALLTQPIVLAVFKKWLRLRVLPWVILLLLMIFIIAIMALAASPQESDPTLTSDLPNFLWFQASIVIAMAVSHLVVYYTSSRERS
jgi:hypothetical protein